MAVNPILHWTAQDGEKLSNSPKFAKLAKRFKTGAVIKLPATDRLIGLGHAPSSKPSWIKFTLCNPAPLATINAVVHTPCVSTIAN